MPSNFKQDAKPQAAQHEAAKSATISGRQRLRLRAAAGHPGWIIFILSILAAWQLAPKQGKHQ